MSTGVQLATDRAQLYAQMLTIRRFEETARDLINQNEIPGLAHEYVGQEAVAVGVIGELDSRDRITSTHRGHGHALARGVDLSAMFAELMGKEGGTNRGRGGSMHIADVELGLLGANGIVGAGAPIACGAAFSLKQEGSGGIVACFFGDGAINQGVVAESMNLAVVWKLPVLFVCENNGYAITTPISSTTARPIHERAESFGMESRICDGMDVIDVRCAVSELVGRVRETNLPAFVECETYRYSGHHTAEAMQGLVYRPDAEIEGWRARDPLQILGRTLDKETIETISEDIEERIRAALETARDLPLPRAESYTTYMYSDRA